MIPMNDHQVYAAVAVLIVLAMTLWLALRGLRRADEVAKRHGLLEAEFAAARDAIARAETAAAEAAAEATRRNADIDGRITGILEQLEQLKLLDEGGSSYNHAIRLAKAGASAAELARDCGLNRGEAELLVSLHGRANPD